MGPKSPMYHTNTSCTGPSCLARLLVNKQSGDGSFHGVKVTELIPVGARKELMLESSVSTSLPLFSALFRTFKHVVNFVNSSKRITIRW